MQKQQQYTKWKGGLRPPSSKGGAAAFGRRPPFVDSLMRLAGKARPTQPSQGKASQAAEPNQPAQKSAFGLPGGSARGTFLEIWEPKMEHWGPKMD